jgi:hypothetical protein
MPAARHPALVPNLLGGSLPDDIQLSLEIILILDRIVSSDKNLSDHGLAVPSRLTEVYIVRRDAPPSEKALPFVLDHLLESPFLRVPLVPVGREKHHADPVFARPRKIDANAFARTLEETVRDLHQNPGAVPRLRFTPAGSSMVEITQHLERLGDDLVGFLALDVDDEPDATRIVLVLRVV